MRRTSLPQRPGADEIERSAAAHGLGQPDHPGVVVAHGAGHGRLAPPPPLSERSVSVTALGCSSRRAGRSQPIATGKMPVLFVPELAPSLVGHFLSAIAGISLVVGGIGIMNIMLVTVTERTREIGLRKAIGAKRRDILFQFLIEAMTLSLLGGLIGVVVGTSGALAIGRLVQNFTPTVAAGSILLATGFSLAVGLFFGLYPALRASRLNPIEALRYE